MTYRNAKVIRITCSAILLFILVGIIHTIDLSDSSIFLQSFKANSINLIYIGLALFWGISLHQRVMQKNILHYLQIMDAGIVFWIILRYVKYDFFVGVAVRYLWYLYYLPQIIVPLLLFYCVISIGRRENENIDRKWYLLLIPASVLFIGVMTNDIHNLAFKFQPGMRDWSSEYSYGILYFMTMLWMIGLVIISLIIIYRKCKVCCSRRKVWIPVGVFIMGTIIGIMELLGMQNFYKIPEIMCATFIGIVESCMQIGLLHINNGYNNLFRKLVIPAELVDKAGKTVYSSAKAIDATSEEKEKALEEPILIGNDYKLNVVEVNGGEFFYCEDVHIINEVNDQLNKIREQLKSENQLITEENEIKKRTIKIEERTKLYEDLSIKIKPQLDMVEKLIDKVSKNDDVENNLSRMCIYGGYIKRLCNLMILSKENNKLLVRELENCIKESFDYLAICGITTSFENQALGMIESEELIQIYSIFELVIEQQLDGMEAILIRIEDVGTDVSFKIMLETVEQTTSIDFTMLQLSAKLDISEIKEENTMYISVMARRGEI